MKKIGFELNCKSVSHLQSICGFILVSQKKGKAVKVEKDVSHQSDKRFSTF